jgi:hypothetical protein
MSQHRQQRDGKHADSDYARLSSVRSVRQTRFLEDAKVPHDILLSKGACPHESRRVHSGAKQGCEELPAQATGSLPDLSLSCEPLCRFLYPRSLQWLKELPNGELRGFGRLTRPARLVCNCATDRFLNSTGRFSGLFEETQLDGISVQPHSILGV